MKRHALALLLVALCGAAAAQPLGRLFFSDAERARLDARRGQPFVNTASRKVGTVRHDGVVTRSSGPPTWFVNGAPADGETLSALPARTVGVTLQLKGADGRPLRLRPGEQAAVSEAGEATPSGAAIDIRPGRTR